MLVVMVELALVAVVPAEVVQPDMVVLVVLVAIQIMIMEV